MRNDKIIRLLMPFLACIAVSACFDNQRRQLARCDLEAKKAGFYSSPVGNEPWHTDNLCMMAAGYEPFSDETNKHRCTIEIMTYENPLLLPTNWVDGSENLLGRARVTRSKA